MKLKVKSIPKYKDGGKKTNEAKTPSWRDAPISLNPYASAIDNTAAPIYIPNQGYVNNAKPGYTPQAIAQSSENTGRAAKIDKRDREARIAQRQSAQQSRANNTPFTFPDGTSKTSEQMTPREASYVQGLSLQNKGRFNENDEAWYDDINPLNFVSSMAGSLATSSYEAQQSNSYAPYLSAIATPLAVGALAGIGATSTGQWMNNLSNPFAGLEPKNIGNKIDELGNKYLPNAHNMNPFRFKANPEAYYHRSPDLNNIINRENNTLQGFSHSDAGRMFNEGAGPGGTGNLAITSTGSKINLRKAANSDLYFSKGVPLDYGRYNSPKLGMTGQGYKGPYLVEVNNVPMAATSNGKRAKDYAPSKLEGYATPTRPIGYDEAKFYKEHWLKGYQPIKFSNGGYMQGQEYDLSEEEIATLKAQVYDIEFL